MDPTLIFRAGPKDFIPGITLARHEEKRISIGSSHYMPPAHLEPDNMITLLQQCISLDITLEVHRFRDKLQELAATGEPAVMVMTKFFTLFTGKLYTMAVEQSTTPIPTNLQNKVFVFTAEIIDMFANRCVGHKPTPPVDWACRLRLRDVSAARFFPRQSLTRRVVDLCIDQPFWKENEPENETQVEPGFTLKIRKTVRAWWHAVKLWEQDQDGAQPQFDKAIDDEGLRDGLRVCLDRLGEGECGLSM
ncbi:uncharacterized protein PV06_11599 [Exophiala oligosperma]|uniref:Uncharacterized protein n=1 Tax=Exophiala oligosperma TaxID=215243 RepID=A0A0D2D1L2_9EURO|nr:uncharacterized protein PV06_11599 [Exophiala oligosperma]KIW36085.1 hypothetical protein PV06_11599 [Exophiala oligosperma]